MLSREIRSQHRHCSVWLQLILHNDFGILEQNDLEGALESAQWSSVFVNLEIDEVLKHFEKLEQHHRLIGLHHAVRHDAKTCIFRQRDFIFRKLELLASPIFANFTLYIAPDKFDELQLSFKVRLIRQ